VTRTAYIADIHADLDALVRVVRALDSRGVDEVVALGDYVGNGGHDPAGVIDLVRARCSLTLCGCNDAALLRGDPSFNPVAQSGIEESRRGLDADGDLTGRNTDRLKFLAALQPKAIREGILLVHASPVDPLHDDLLRSDVEFRPAHVAAVFGAIEALAIGGHTHVPGAFVENVGFVRPEDVNGRLRFQNRKVFVQVGSVGRPRDGTGKSCMAIVDDDGVEWVRVGG
jgi:diadenosine tetraphosphatase ApaH/serine/threonine PP2A family protein phosphatase